ncbi:unnamed protein product [Trichobilharzia regenti]|nr:unnamed protein product [Trichobilharzia regenti]
MCPNFKYLHSEGVDVTGLMVRIEEVIIKSFLCVLPPINVACRMFPASKARCFELYGFDIIIDENFRPWLLEVNLSPSLVCDSPLDFKVKSHMLTDLFNLVGITCHDPSRKSRGMCNGSNVTSNGTSFVPPDPSAYFVSASDQCFRNASNFTNDIFCSKRDKPVFITEIAPFNCAGDSGRIGPFNDRHFCPIYTPSKPIQSSFQSRKAIRNQSTL